MTFKFAVDRTGRPRTPIADIERRRSRYRAIRARLPLSNAEIAEKLGQHPSYVRNYPNGRVPTDETMDILEGKPSAEKRMAGYRKLREIIEFIGWTDPEFASYVGLPVDRIRTYETKAPSIDDMKSMIEHVSQYLDTAAFESLEYHAEILNYPHTDDISVWGSDVKEAKQEFDDYVEKGIALEIIEKELGLFVPPVLPTYDDGIPF